MLEGNAKKEISDNSVNSVDSGSKLSIASDLSMDSVRQNLSSNKNTIKAFKVPQESSMKNRDDQILRIIESRAHNSLVPLK